MNEDKEAVTPNKKMAEIEDLKELEAPQWVKPVMNKLKIEICAEVTAKVAYSVRLMLDKTLEDVKLLLQQAALENKDHVCKCCMQHERREETNPDVTLRDDQRDEGKPDEDAEGIFLNFPRGKHLVAFVEQELTHRHNDLCVKEIKEEGKEGEKQSIVSVVEEQEEEKEFAVESLPVPEPEENTLASMVPRTEEETLTDQEQNHQNIEGASGALPEEPGGNQHAEVDQTPSFVVCDEPPFSGLRHRERDVSISSCTSEFEVVPMPSSSSNSQHSYSSAETCPLPASDDDDTDVEDFFRVQKKHFMKRYNLHHDRTDYSSVPYYELSGGDGDNGKESREPGIEAPAEPGFGEYPGSTENELETSTATLIENGMPNQIDGNSSENEEQTESEKESPETKVCQNEASIIEGSHTGIAEDVTDAGKTGTAESLTNSFQLEGGAVALASPSPKPQLHPSEKVFTPDFFEQVEAFTKKTVEDKTNPAKKTLPPYAGISLESPLDPPRVFGELPAAPLVSSEPSGNLDPENVLWLPSPYELRNCPAPVRNTGFPLPPPRRTARPRHAATQGPVNPVDFTPEIREPVLRADVSSGTHSHVYPVDVPAETLWEGALTRAAQAYNTAKTAVDDISDTFNHVKDHVVSELKHPGRGRPMLQPRSRPCRQQLPKPDPRKEQHLKYLDEMGFRNSVLNAQLLEKHDFDLEAVVVALVELQDGW